MNRGKNARSKNIKVGERFGKLSVTGTYEMVQTKECKRAVYPVHCDCGNDTTVLAMYLLGKHTTSCNSCVREWHGESNTSLYHRWHHIKTRCTKATDTRFADYGGRGIKMYQPWLDSFANFREWAYENGYEEGLTIERVNVDGDYCPENCTWIPLEQQNNNKRNTVRLEAFGETKRLSEWARDERCVVDYFTLYGRIKKGWQAEVALTSDKRTA